MLQKPPAKVIPEKKKQDLDKSMIFRCLDDEGRLSHLVRRLHVMREALVRFHLLHILFFLLRACAVCEWSMRTWWYFSGTTWVMMPKSITSSSISEFVDALWARLWLIPCGTESWLARTPWVLGFFSGRGKPLALWGGTGECPPGKREGGLPELLTVPAAILKENYLLDPWVDF